MADDDTDGSVIDRNQVCIGSMNDSDWLAYIDKESPPLSPFSKNGSLAATASGSTGSGNAGERRDDQSSGDGDGFIIHCDTFDVDSVVSDLSVVEELEQLRLHDADSDTSSVGGFGASLRDEIDAFVQAKIAEEDDAASVTSTVNGGTGGGECEESTGDDDGNGDGNNDGNNDGNSIGVDFGVVFGDDVSLVDEMEQLVLERFDTGTLFPDGFDDDDASVTSAGNGSRGGGECKAKATTPFDLRARNPAFVLATVGRCPLELFLASALADEKNRFSPQLLSYIKNTEAFVLTKEMREKTVYTRCKINKLFAGQIGFTCRYCQSARDATYPTRIELTFEAVRNHGRGHINCAKRPADPIVAGTQRKRSTATDSIKDVIFPQAFSQAKLVNDDDLEGVCLDPNFDPNAELENVDANSATEEVDNEFSTSDLGPATLEGYADVSKE